MPDNTTQLGNLRISIIFKGIGFSYLLTIPLFAVFSFILSRVEFPERLIGPAVMVTTVASILTAGLLTSINLKSRGWMNGAFVGLVYMLILYLSSSIIYGSFPADRRTFTMMIIGALAGTIGGIIGINLKKTKPRYVR